MPYFGEVANKASHFDIIKNPEVSAFLDGCDFLKTPSEAEGEQMGTRFALPPSVDGAGLPERVIAVDGSYYETSLSEHLPSTKVGYVKIGCVLINLDEFKSLRVQEGRFVDPFRVASLQRNNDALTLTLPSANLRLKNRNSVRDSFREAVDDHLCGEKTRFKKDDPQTSLRTTLFHLAALRPGEKGTGDPSRLRIQKCPDCGEGPVEVRDVPGPQRCPHCGGQVYPADCLRVWEEVNEFQSNIEPMSRFMLQVEHILPVHYMRYLAEHSPASLAGVAFFVDGPLAVFGNGAWLHASIMRFLAGVNEELKKSNRQPVLMIGLQKTGQVVEHFKLIDRFVPLDRLLILDDDYRYKFVFGGRDASANGFGSETYYGQDFLYKTPSGRLFVFAVPYPFREKNAAGVNFIQAKTEMARYTELARTLRMIQHFECDLYENAVVPIALAHRYTAISLVPGGRVLDLLTRHALEPRYNNPVPPKQAGSLP